MNRADCEVIRDLLPLYVEDLASAATRSMVEEHISACEECRKEQAALSANVPMPQNTDIKAMKNISVRLLRKKAAAVCAGVLTMILILVLIAINVNAPIVLPYEEVKETVSVSKNEAGELVFDMKDPTLAIDIEYLTGEDGVYTADVSCYTTKWKQLFEKAPYRSQVVFPAGNQPVQRISYYPTASGENICLYEDAEEADNTSAGYVTLPRLVLHSYMLFAVILSLAGAIVCVCLRKRTDALYKALKAALVPVAYLISSVVILSGKGDIYNSLYYFSGILLSTILMSLIGWSVLSLIRYRKIGIGQP